MTRSRPSTAWTFAITSIALFMVALDNLVVTTALPVIKADLGASLADLEWMVNAYTLTFAVLLLTGAALGDRFGRKRIFLVGMAIFTGGSALAALAPSIRHPDPGPRHPGRRRRVRHPAHPDHPVRRGPARATSGRPRRVGRHRRPRHRHRPARRRRHRRGPRLALDLLAQRADRPRRHAAGRPSPDREPRPRGPPRHPGPRRSSAPACWPSSGASSTATTSAGPARRSSARSARASRSSSASSPGRRGPRSRCCRSASSGSAPSARPTPSRS